MKHENEDNTDMLSDLPDCLLIHILSFLNSKYAVQTCILSSRWKHLWKYLTALTLDSCDFMSVDGFMEFVSRILSLRDNSMPLNALDFNFDCRSYVKPRVLERIIGFTASHDVNSLRLFYQFGGFSPSFLLSCHSLTSLEIGYQNYEVEKKFPNSLNLPSLTYLKLHCFSFCARNDGCVEPFSSLNRLHTLFLYDCLVEDAQQPLCISSTTLFNLSIIYSNYEYSKRNFLNIEILAPSMCTFALTCFCFPKISGSQLSSIEQVNINVWVFVPPLDLFNFLKELTNIKSLTVTPTTLRGLSLVDGISKLKLTCLCNLKSLNLKLKLTHWRHIKPELGKSWKENAKLREAIKGSLIHEYSSILDGMIEFLLQNSPSAKVDILFES